MFAVKIIEKKRLNKSGGKLMKLFETEVSIMSELNHPNIMHLYEYMETANNYYLVIQFCNNGDLEKYLEKHIKLTENEAVYFLR